MEARMMLFSLAIFVALVEVSTASLQDEHTIFPLCRPISRIPGTVHASYVFPNETEHEVGSYCDFECSKGLFLVGSTRSHCIFDESLGVSYYEEYPPKCKAPSKAKCPVMKPVEGGSVECSNRNRIGSECIHKCPAGYEMVQGDTVSTCQVVDRVVSWSPQSPGECVKVQKFHDEDEPKCPIMTPVEGGSVECSNGTQIGSECIHKCPTGYEMVQGTTASTCQVVDGVVGWSSQSPGDCVKAQKFHDEASATAGDGGVCPPIYSSGAVSHFTCTSGRALGSKCNFHCMTGYGILGSRIVSCVTTKSGPRWTGNTPRCQLKTCPALPSKVENGKFVCTRSNRLKSQCIYRCDEGYHVNGIPQVTCFSGRSDSYLGVWSHNDIPKCTRCMTDQFHCAANDRCIDAMKLCDGTLDCPDGGDEKMCLDGERLACGTLHNGNSGFLRSPTLTNGLYSHCTYCNWTIEVPKGYKIKMHFLAFDIEYSGPECEFDGVAIGDIDDGQEAIDAFDWSSTSLVKQRFCGRRQFLSPVVSDSNRVGIVFYSNYNKEGRGFSLLWSKIKSKTS